jgi:hypothetical protein
MSTHFQKGTQDACKSGRKITLTQKSAALSKNSSIPSNTRKQKIQFVESSDSDSSDNDSQVQSQHKPAAKKKKCRVARSDNESREGEDVEPIDLVSADEVSTFIATPC